MFTPDQVVLQTEKPFRKYRSSFETITNVILKYDTQHVGNDSLRYTLYTNDKCIVIDKDHRIALNEKEVEALMQVNDYFVNFSSFVDVMVNKDRITFDGGTVCKLVYQRNEEEPSYFINPNEEIKPFGLYKSQKVDDHYYILYISAFF